VELSDHLQKPLASYDAMSYYKVGISTSSSGHGTRHHGLPLTSYPFFWIMVLLGTNSLALNLVAEVINGA